MGIITADTALLSVLGGLKEMMEIRDSSGNVLGYFTPREQAEDKLYEQAAALVDVEEMERRAATEKTGHSIEEVRRHLKSLETS